MNLSIAAEQIAPEKLPAGLDEANAELSIHANELDDFTQQDPDSQFCEESDSQKEHQIPQAAEKCDHAARSSISNKKYIGENNIGRGESTPSEITNHNNDNKNNIEIDEKKLNEILDEITEAFMLGSVNESKSLSYLDMFSRGLGFEVPESHFEECIELAKGKIKRAKKNLTGQIREWISITSGNFSITDLLQTITMITKEDRVKVTVIINRLIKEGLIERVGNKHGVYRRVENECEVMDFINADIESVPIWLPFGIHERVSIMPGNIILLAGSPNAGKTGLLLNIIQQNQDKFETHYFNSEMGESELKKRLMLFEGTPLDSWKFKAWERSSNFADVIKPGPGKLNIIDFLEIHDNFYEIGGRLGEIHNKLNGAVAIVALQKNMGSDTGLGGGRSLEKPRLYLSMEPGRLKIVKAKNWQGSDNPNGQQVTFKTIKGCKFPLQQDWHYPAENE
jgi:hypothetical protein